MLQIILLVIYILSILAVIFVERKNPTEALLWVLVMVCLPYVGLLLYLVFGSTVAIKLTALNRHKRLSRRLPPAAAPQDLLEGQQFSPEDLQVIRFNTTYNESPVTCRSSGENCCPSRRSWGAAAGGSRRLSRLCRFRAVSLMATVLPKTR